MDLSNSSFLSREEKVKLGYSESDKIMRQPSPYHNEGFLEIIKLPLISLT